MVWSNCGKNSYSIPPHPFSSEKSQIHSAEDKLCFCSLSTWLFWRNNMFNSSLPPAIFSIILPITDRLCSIKPFVCPNIAGKIQTIFFFSKIFTRTSMLVVGIVCPGHFRAMCLVSVSEKALTATIKDSPSQAIENNQRFQESDDWKSLLLGTVDQAPTSPLDKSSLYQWLRELKLGPKHALDHHQWVSLTLQVAISRCPLPLSGEVCIFI